MTEAQAIDFLMEHKGPALSATAWEDYVTGGRGFLLSDGSEVAYCSGGIAPLFRAIHKRLQRLLKSYQPAREIVVVFAVPFDGRAMLALGKRTPALTPEEAFLALAGTPGMPPMQVVLVPVAQAQEARS
jgi:hypothetical protein